MYIYKVKMKGDVAHRLEHYEGPCKNWHGHTIMVEVEIGFNAAPKDTNMLIDFKQIKKWLEIVVPDHESLNERYNCKDPTAEFLVKAIYEELETIIEKQAPTQTTINSVTVWESENAGVSYFGG